MNKLGNFLFKFARECLETIAFISYDWLVVAGLIGLVLYLFGYEKGKKVGMLMPAIYVILQIISKVLCHA